MLEMTFNQSFLRRHRSFLAYWLLCFVLLLPLRAFAAEQVVIRTKVIPDSSIWVGQQVVLQLDILALDGWADSKRLPDFSVDGAYILRVESQGTRLSETISGGSYSGQRHEWLLFPQRGGQINIPSTEVEVRLKTFGVDSSEQIIPLQTEAVAFVAEVPPGAEQIEGLISTTELTAAQSWEPDDAALRAGDGVKRTISFRAANVSGMAFMPLKPETAANLAIYPGEPEVSDQIDRGILAHGRRTETLTYVPAQAGEYRIPDISISWWDIKHNKLHRETLEGITLTVAKAPQSDSTDTPMSAAGKWLQHWKALLFLALLLGALWLLWQRRLYPAWKRKQAVRRDSEPAWFKRFTNAAGKEGPDETMAALMQWLDRLQLPDRPARLRPFMHAYGDDHGREQVEKFIAAFSKQPDSEWNTQQLIAAIRSARNNYLKQSRRAADKQGVGNLQPLNPSMMMDE